MIILEPDEMVTAPRICPWDESPLHPGDWGPHCRQCADLIAQIRRRRDLVPIAVRETEGTMVADPVFYHRGRIELGPAMDYLFGDIRRQNLPLRFRPLDLWLGEVDDRIVALVDRAEYPISPLIRMSPEQQETQERATLIATTMRLPDNP